MGVATLNNAGETPSFEGGLFHTQENPDKSVYYHDTFAQKESRYRNTCKVGGYWQAINGITKSHTSDAGTENMVETGTGLDLYNDENDVILDEDNSNHGDGEGDGELNLDPDSDSQDQSSGTLSRSQQKRFSARRADKVLMEQLKFMDDFDPQIRSELKKRKRYNDGRNAIIASESPECDCLVRGCPGCHYPCKSCGERKCGHECRQGRKWVYESIEIEGRGRELKNRYFFTHQVNKPAN